MPSPVSVPKTVRSRRLQRRKLLKWGVRIGAAGFLLLGLRVGFAPRPGKPLSLAYAWIPSPNCDLRPDEAKVTCVVIHATATSTTESTLAHFLNPASKVSAHFVVGKAGEVVQMVAVEKRAWHAGTSVLEGQERVNDFSIGIELVNLNDGHDPFTEAQYLAAAGILRLLRTRFTIPSSRIVSHAQVALPLGRKTDPLGFDFTKLLSLLAPPE